MIAERLLTIYGAADLLRVTPRRLGQFIRDGAVPYIELPGGQIRFDERDLRQWAESLKRLPAGHGAHKTMA